MLFTYEKWSLPVSFEDKQQNKKLLAELSLSRHKYMVDYITTNTVPTCMDVLLLTVPGYINTN